MEDGTVPNGIATGQIVVDGDKVGAFAFEGVEDERGDGDEGFSFTGLHLGDSSLVEDGSSDDLDVEVSHAKGAPANFADDGEDFGEQLIEGFTIAESLSPVVWFVSEIGLGEFEKVFLHLADLVDDGGERFDIALAGVKKLA